VYEVLLIVIALSVMIVDRMLQRMLWEFLMGVYLQPTVLCYCSVYSLQI